ncbi:site-2 protease family protein [Candidatus Laterigemmans baculatus]|uniref:site-2 protease family protein n=1 Tax=Candidatus Laterigemmans baculatus TaxID=2770505 RepID=UPI0013DD00BD|nr:site-2 protease family protein [Candidatus Laterigemmans baculatus]
MLKRKLTRRLKVGRFLGIDLFIHWSYWLLPLSLGGWSLAAGEGWEAALINVLRIFALFVCVTLHEYGHAMAARRFGVRTVDITLLPIGGLARLERMPRVPWQEFLVAVAGPAVNVAIAALIALGLVIFVPAVCSGSLDVIEPILLTTTAGWLLAVNIALVLFNMIPAFPMDGGRVLRSLLAMVLEYRRATQVAARIGLVAAVLMAFVGFQSQAIVMVLIAAFIGYAGWMESRHVEASELIRGIRIEDAMIRDTTSVHALDSLATLVEFFHRRSLRSVPVLGVGTHYLGMLGVDAVAEAVRSGRTTATASDLLTRSYPTLEAPGSLAAQVGGLPPRQQTVVPVLDAQGRLLGVLDFESLADRLALAPWAQGRGGPDEAEIFDAVLVERPRGADTYA